MRNLYNQNTKMEGVLKVEDLAKLGLDLTLG